MQAATQRAPSLPIYAQPTLERLSDGLFAKAEASAQSICESFEALLASMGVDGLVLKSPSHVQPSWVKLECWLPTGNSLVTERDSATITVEPKPFHRFELVYAVTWNKAGKSKTVKELGQFTQSEAAALTNFLLANGPEPNLKQFRFRQHQWEFWKPINKISAVSTDWMAVGVVLLWVLGFATLAMGVGLFLLVAAGILTYLLQRRKRTVRSSGKPVFEPRNLSLVDNWQTVVTGAGVDAELVRRRFMDAMSNPPSPHFRFAVERIWYWGLDTKEEREQIVLTFNRAVFFAKIFQYGRELYVGWDSHLNRGTWIEKTIASGMDTETGRLAQINTVVPAVQVLTEYDLSDVSCLTEWAHAQIVRIVKNFLEERRIDQEIDFKIVRGERQGIVGDSASAAGKPGGGFIKRLRGAAGGA